MSSKILKELVDDQSGATLIEYGLIIALITLAMVAALGSVADTTIAMWDRVKTRVVDATSKS